MPLCDVVLHSRHTAAIPFMVSLLMHFINPAICRLIHRGVWEPHATQDKNGSDALNIDGYGASLNSCEWLMWNGQQPRTFSCFSNPAPQLAKTSIRTEAE